MELSFTIVSLIVFTQFVISFPIGFLILGNKIKFIPFVIRTPIHISLGLIIITIMLFAIGIVIIHYYFLIAIGIISYLILFYKLFKNKPSIHLNFSKNWFRQNYVSIVSLCFFILIFFHFSFVTADMGWPPQGDILHHGLYTSLIQHNGKLEGTILVTGGAGFIGSHIVDRLVSNEHDVKVIDNLSNGKLSNLKDSKNKKNFQFMNKDLNQLPSIEETMTDVKLVFHMAADPEVSIGFKNPDIHYKENIQNTFHLLEAIRKADVENILFASTSTVYGEPDIIPTPENYAPLLPISTYGASKLACEALISSYCYTYGINGILFRLANIVGSRSNHGIIPDFIKKLQSNPNNLEILGDGTQSKSYLEVSDCVDSFFFCLENVTKKVEVFNIGNHDRRKASLSYGG